MKLFLIDIFYKLASGIGDFSNKVFVMKSKKCPASMKYDHIGFVLTDGRLKDMSGHRYDEEQGIPLPPMVQTHSDYQNDPLFLNMGNENDYLEYQLPFTIEVPDYLPEEEVVNCGTYVLAAINHHLKKEEGQRLQIKSFKIDDILAAVKSL